MTEDQAMIMAKIDALTARAEAAEAKAAALAVPLERAREALRWYAGDKAEEELPK